MSNECLFFGSFLLFIVLMMAIDLGVFNKGDHTISFRKAILMSCIWVSFAVGFYFFLLAEGNLLHGIANMEQLTHITQQYLHSIKLVPDNFEASMLIYKQNLALEFFTGYVVEYALSVDNIFVMVMIFNAYRVNEKYYHRVLFWGIIGAVLMRFLFIFIGATLIAQFNWILYVFGAFLVYTGAMLLINKDADDEIDPEKHTIVKLASKYFSVLPRFEGNKFFVKKDGKTYVTTLFLVLLVVEFTDLIFAVDSIPAIFAVTKDPYIVFFSNIFAILGLRSMFFLLVNIIQKFHYLKYGLAILLLFIGAKMLAHHWLVMIGFTIVHSLMVIIAILTISVIVSLLFPPQKVSKIAE